jgi:spore coat polysaccharide biosynthesis predicted glycosyltransferase SpsG/RimJ/RimL family protein N-acetyltransferase
VSLSEAAAILRVTVRTAASAGIGAGHVARTTAVAAQLARIGADVRWACDEATVAYLVERGVRADRIHVLRHAATAGRSGEAEATDAAQAEDARETLALGPADCALVDSYQLGVAWQRTARAAGVRVAAFDDLAERPVEADLVINAAASPGGYDALAPNARVLAGLPYAITGDPSRPPAAGPGTLLLAFGAADPGNLTEATLRALAELRDAQGSPFPETVIQLGSGASGRPKVAELVATLAWATFATAGPTSPGAPAIAIGAAGVGLLERMQAGVPSVVVVAAPNQRALADAAKRSGAAVAVADVRAACAEALRLLADPAALARMSAAGRAAVDGRGAARVARELNRLAGVDLRHATLRDAELLHRWRNDPSVRAVSHTTDEIPWETHVRWLESSLARGDRHVLVAERRGRPLGTLRFDVSGDRATVSIAVDPALHGSGLGPAILDAGDAWLKANDARVRTCRAEIRDGNDASVRAFLAAGYLPGNDSYERPVGRRTEA